MELILDKKKIGIQMKRKNSKLKKEHTNLVSSIEKKLSLMLGKDNKPLITDVPKLAEHLADPLSKIIVSGADVKKGFDRHDYRHDVYSDVTEVIPKKNFTVLETFAGAGGLALGLEKSGLSSVGAIELDKNAAQTLRMNRPNWNIIESDITEVAEGGVKQLLKVKDVDVLSGGYPCQTFSYAGKRKGLEDTRGTLFYPYSKILNELNPKIFIAENVKGLVNHDHGKTLETMIKVFKKSGYTIYWNVLNAWDYDVAQKRERIVIIGIRNDLVKIQKYEFAFPEKQKYKPVLRDVILNVKTMVDVNYSESKKRIMELVPPGGSWVNLPQEIAKEYLGKSWYSGGGKRGMARRLSWDQPSLTLTTSPSQKQTERCHPVETRPLSILEYARIQSFPDEWVFEGSVTSQYKQIGNAVPVNLAEYIGKAVVKYLNQF